MITRITRAVVSVIVLALLAFAIASQAKAAKLRTLNYLMPSSYAGLSDPAQIQPYLRYYHAVFLLTPLKADARAMMGFCYAQQGRWSQAEQAYEEAVRLGPRSFWAQYDLALVYIRQGQYPKARDMLERAAGIAPMTALENITASKIYMDIINDLHLTPQALAARIVNGYKGASSWLASGQAQPAMEFSIF